VWIATAVRLWPLMPQALAFASLAQLEQANRDLSQQITERREAEAAVLRLNDELEQRVRERAADLEAANERLRTEIRERTQAEEQLRASELRYRQVVEVIREAIWIHCDGRGVFANGAGARLFGVEKPEGLVGEPVLNLIGPGDRERAAQRSHILVQDRRPVPLTEMQLQRLDGKPLIVEIQGVPFSHEGRPAVLAV